MDELQQDWDRQSELLERILDGEPVEDVLASEPDAAVREAVLSMLQHHREAEKTGFLDAPPTLVRALHEGTDGPSLKGGERLNDRFVILRHIGSGGMGEVYLARDEVMNDDVALKIIRPELSEDPRIRTRFIAEVRNARRVTHTNVCHVYDIVERAELPFFTMEYLPGRTLAEALGAGSLDGAAKKRIAAQLANGLDAAHLRGIIHRDFKPANVMLTERNGRLDAVIMDFGLARTEEMTDPGNAHSLQAGTEEYMAPELLQGSKATLQSDVYAYGKVLQQLLPNHPLLSKLLAERPEDRQPSLRAVIASFDDANGKATRRTWMLGTAAAAATGYSLWELSKPPKVAPPTRQHLLVNAFHGPPEMDRETQTLHELVVLGLQQSPLLTVVGGAQLVSELKRYHLPVSIPMPDDLLQRLAQSCRSMFTLTGAVSMGAAGANVRLSLTPCQPGKSPVRIDREVGKVNRSILVAQDIVLRIREEVGESITAIRNSYSPLEAVTSSSEEAVQYYFEAVRYYEKASSADAKALLDRALEIDPRFALAWHYRALAVATLGSYEEALSNSRTALRMSGHISTRERNWISSLYHFLSGDYERAREFNRNNAVLFPEDAMFARQVGLGEALVGNMQSSVAFAKKARLLDPFSVNNQSQVVVSLAESGAYNEALVEAENAKRQLGDEPLIEWGRGLAFCGLRMFSEAERSFARLASHYQFRHWGRCLSAMPQILRADWDAALATLMSQVDIEQSEPHTTEDLQYIEWIGWSSLVGERQEIATRVANHLVHLPASPVYASFIRSGAVMAAVAGLGGLISEAQGRFAEIQREFPSSRMRCMGFQVAAMDLRMDGKFALAKELLARSATQFGDSFQFAFGSGLLDRAAVWGEYSRRKSEYEGRTLKYEWPGWLAFSIGDDIGRRPIIVIGSR